MTVRRHQIGFRWIAFGALVSAYLFALPAHADSDKFMCIEGVEGGSSSTQFPGCSDVFAYSQETPVDTSPVTGTPACFEVVVVKPIDTASPQLFLTALGERVLRLVDVYFRSEGPRPRVFFRARMRDVFIARIRNSEGSGDDGTSGVPIQMEQLVLIPTRLKLFYTPINDDGTASPPISAGWDCAAKRPF